MNYRIRGKTAVSIYSSATDTPGTIEVAFEVDTLADIASVSPSAVNAWIRDLQQKVGRYAKPKTQYQYPRLALSSETQIDAFIDAVRTFLAEEAEAEQVETDEEQEIAEQEVVVDERVLASILTRRGQQAFREGLLRAYRSSCAITGCDTVAVLEAAHIVPYSERHSYAISNGILLRADVHTLFDLFLISVSPETGIVVVADGCKPAYDFIDGVSMAVPESTSELPNPALLMEHFSKWKRRNQS